MSKKHSFLSRISKTMFPCWICRKTIIEKGGHFLAKNHGIHLLKNILFFVLFQSSLLLSKKHSFVSRISNKRCFLAGYAQNPPLKKVAIFGQKLWTNPFGKFWFLGIFFLKLDFSCLDRILFYLGHQKTMFPGWICRKTIIEKGGHFLAKNHGIHLLKNILFFVLFQSSLLLSKKHSFVSRISNKRCFLAGYAQNPPFKKVAIFGQKL